MTKDWVISLGIERGRCQDGGAICTLSVMTQKIENMTVCICVESVSHLGAWWIDRQRNWSFLFGPFHQACFPPVREDFPTYLHFRAYIGLSEWREDWKRLEKTFFLLKFQCISSDNIFGTEYSDSCLIISFILRILSTFNKYLLNTCYVLGTVGDAWDHHWVNQIGFPPWCTPHSQSGKIALGLPKKFIIPCSPSPINNFPEMNT